MYEDLINKLRELPHLLFVQLGEHEDVVYQAADAIEKLEQNSVPVNDMELILDEVAKPQWIPVTERLPEHLTSVIVHRKDGGIFIWEYFDNSQTDECWIDDRMNVYSFYDVTHWRPLPKPPKEE